MNIENRDLLCYARFDQRLLDFYEYVFRLFIRIIQADYFASLVNRSCSCDFDHITNPDSP